MYILHIETSTKICSVAVSENDRLIEVVDLPEGMNHTAQLTPAIQEILKSCHLIPKDLGAIAVSSGPGSYTGLRVGSSTAKAMSYSLKIPIIPVPTLLALASAGFLHHPDADVAMPMLDARRNEVFMAMYRPDLTELVPASSFILEDRALMELADDFDKVITVGDGALKLKPHLAAYVTIDISIQATARHLVKPAYAGYLAGKTSDPIHFVPFYLKPPNITTPGKVV